MDTASSGGGRYVAEGHKLNKVRIKIMIEANMATHYSVHISF